jgi:hypothetical protein
MRDILTYRETEKLKILLKLYRVETPEQFEALCEKD